MKTAMQELIELLKIEENFISDNDSHEDRCWRNGVRFSIKKAIELLEKEKQLACQFAKEYINGASYDNLQDYYDEKFLTQPNL